MSCDSWLGYLVRVDCGEIGSFKGKVCSINEEHGFLRLENAMLDGEPVACNIVTIKTTEISSLEFISIGSSRVCKNILDDKPSQNESLKDQLVSSKRSSLNKKSSSTPDQKPNTVTRNRPKSLKKRTQECFNIKLDDVSLPDFDFEHSSMLFDKDAILEELKEGVTLGFFESGDRKLNYDENVLEQEPVSMRQIVAPIDHTGQEYHTDEGVIVPAISMELKNTIIKSSENMGLTAAQRIENAGMCICQMALQLLGGSNRFTQRNAHQPPHVILMAGPNHVGVYGICAARHLANHKVQVTLFVPIKTEELVPHLALFYHTGFKLVSSLADLPSEPVDLVIYGLVGHEEESANQISKLMPVTRWANSNKAPVLILDPCSRVRMFGVEPKWALAFALPLIDAPSSCRMYLADLGIPKGIYTATDIKYTSPFGDKFVIALNE